MAQGQRRLDRSQQSVNLPFEPAIVQAQLTDIFDDQMQQLEQGVLDLNLLLGSKQCLPTEVAQHPLNHRDISPRLTQQLQ